MARWFADADEEPRRFLAVGLRQLDRGESVSGSLALVWCLAARDWSSKRKVQDRD